MNHRFAMLALGLMPPPGVVANGGEYPSPIDPGPDPEPDSDPSADAIPDAAFVLSDVDITSSIFNLQTEPLAATRRTPRKYAWHRAGEAPGTFRKEVEHRRKKNKAARKARKKNRK